ERNQFAPDDLVGLAAAAPAGLDRPALDGLGGIARVCLQGGTVVDAIVQRFKAETAKPKGALTARQSARALAQAGAAAPIGDSLPSVEKAGQEKALEALTPLARPPLGQYDRDKKLTWLDSAWSVLQAALAVPPSPENRAEMEEALRHSVELAPRLKAELGQK